MGVLTAEGARRLASPILVESVARQCAQMHLFSQTSRRWTVLIPARLVDHLQERYLRHYGAIEGFVRLLSFVSGRSSS